MSSIVNYNNNPNLEGLISQVTIQVQVIEDAIQYNLKNSAERELNKLLIILADYGNAVNQELLLSLIDRVNNIKDASSSSQIVIQQLPAGIKREGNNCGLNVIGQFIAGCPEIAQRAASSTTLAPFLNQILDAQQKQTSVDAGFGNDLRNWVTVHTTDNAWQAYNYHTTGKSIDVHIGLQTVLEQLHFRYDLQQKMSHSDKWRQSDDIAPFISLDLSTQYTDFNTLWNQFFIDQMQDEQIKCRRFGETPNTLIVKAERMKFVDNTAKKISDPIQNVPLYLELESAYTQNNQSTSYELIGCIIHSGDEKDGHYTYLRKSKDTWYHINDAVVKQVEDPTTLLKQGYFYIFQKKDASFDAVKPVHLTSIPKNIVPEEESYPNCTQWVRTAMSYLFAFATKLLTA